MGNLIDKSKLVQTLLKIRSPTNHIGPCFTRCTPWVNLTLFRLGRPHALPRITEIAVAPTPLSDLLSHLRTFRIAQGVVLAGSYNDLFVGHDLFDAFENRVEVFLLDDAQATHLCVLVPPQHQYLIVFGLPSIDYIFFLACKLPARINRF
jgi:hypothetical protein